MTDTAVQLFKLELFFGIPQCSILAHRFTHILNLFNHQYRILVNSYLSLEVLITWFREGEVVSGTTKMYLLLCNFYHFMDFSAFWWEGLYTHTHTHTHIYIYIGKKENGKFYFHRTAEIFWNI